MAFQIKDFASITAGMLNWMRSATRKVTDYNQGSVARTLLEASAAEIEELYLQYFIGLKEAIPTSVFNTFGFPALEANSASGLVRFTAPTPLEIAAMYPADGDLDAIMVDDDGLVMVTPIAGPSEVDVPIPAGTIVSAANGTKTYVTQGDAVLAAGDSTVDVLVAAQQPGLAGNIFSGAIDTLVSPLPGISTVTNLVPFINGRDAENDDERKARFRAYIASLARGTVAAVIYGAKTARLVDSSGVITEFVESAGIVEPWKTNPAYPVGLVNVYVHNGSGGTTAELVEEAQRVIDGYNEVTGVAVPGWRAAGVHVVVAAATDTAVNVAGVVTLLPGFVEADVLPIAGDAIRAYIASRTIGEAVLRSELISIVMRDVPGVFNVVITAPAADVVIASSAKAISGAVALTSA